MSESHNEQPTKLTYPNKTNNTIQLVVYDSDWEQTAKPNIQQEDITFTLVKQHLSSDKENDGGLIKIEEDIGISNSESQVLLLQSWYGLLHYAILISRTGLVIFFSTYLI